MEASGQLDVKAALPSGNSPYTLWIEGLTGHRVDLDIVEYRKISCTCRESTPDSSVIQPVAY
jgi:hypothetical protein